MDAVTQLQTTLNERRAQLEGTCRTNPWRVAPGKFSFEEARAEHESWEEVTLGHSWAPGDNAKAFWHTLVIPDEIAGIPTAGSAATMEVFCLTGATFYVNGEPKVEAEFWADSAVVPFEISPDAPGTYEIFVQTLQGDGWGLFPFAELRIGVIEEWMFQLSTFAEEIGWCRFVIEQSEIPDDGTLDRVVQSVKGDAPWDELKAQMDAARAELAPIFSEAVKTYRVHLAGHAHIDMNWLWPWRETVDLVRRDFESVDAIMRDYPGVCFSHSQAATYRAMQDQFPHLFERVKQRIAEGTWEVTASTWVEGDLNMSGYETLVRQFQEGMRYCRDELGVTPEICWEPDTFGHPWTMPQILRRAGVRYYYHTRCGKGEWVYWWEGPDGSRVLVFNDMAGYNGRVWAHNACRAPKILRTRYGLRDGLYVFGIGDHGGGPTRADVQRAIRLNESPLLPNVQFSKTIDFYRKLEASDVQFPVIKSELNTIFEGCYTSHGDIKKANRTGEHALVGAETLASIAASRGHTKTAEAVSAGELREPWRTQCFNQFHDILCGCAISITYNEAVPEANDAIAAARRVQQDALSSIVSDASGAVTVVNTLSWDRTDVAWVDGVDWTTGTLVSDGTTTTPVQRVGDRVVFVASGVPAFGTKTYRPVEGAADEFPIDGMNLFTGRYTASIDTNSGTIVWLGDARTGRQFGYGAAWLNSALGGQGPGYLNQLELAWEAPHGMSAWIIGAFTRTLALVRGAQVVRGDDGPVMQEVVVTHTTDVGTIVERLRTFNGIDRIDAVFDIDWNGVGNGTEDAPSLRMRNTVNIGPAKATYDIPFGSIERRADGREQPGIHWVDLSEDTAGLAVLNDGKYGHSVNGHTIVSTLVRSSYEPDNKPDIGRHQFTMSLVPHEGDAHSAGIERRGYAFNAPLLAVAGEATSASSLAVEEMQDGQWVPATSVIVTAYKPADGDPGASIVRLAELHGRTVRIRLVTDASRVEEVDVHEQGLRNVQLEVGTIAAHQVRTFKVTR